MADGFESGSVFPCHLNDSVDLTGSKWFHSWVLIRNPVLNSRRTFGRRARRHRSLQCRTSSQFLAHFFLQVIGRPQVQHGLTGRCSFFIGDALLSGTNRRVTSARVPDAQRYSEPNERGSLSKPRIKTVSSAPRSKQENLFPSGYDFGD